jgi:hypothetical protein
MSADVLERISGSNTLIVSFGGYYCTTFEFKNFLGEHFSHWDQIFLKDTLNSNYHKGVSGLSTDVDGTLEYLKKATQGYQKTIFLGNSGGGYAAILFGSLVSVTHVIAFVPQTILRKPDKDKRYRDLVPFANPNVEYHFIADEHIKARYDPHHKSHCERFPGAKITSVSILNLAQFRDSGKLKELLEPLTPNHLPKEPSGG